MKKTIRILIRTIAFAILLFVGFIIFATLNDYKPDEKIVISENTSPIQIKDSTFSFITYNIGYCGLSKETDFFYDGGESVYPEMSTTQKNLKGISEFIKNTKTDFWLFQEVDKNSKRSSHIDLYAEIQENLAGYHGDFATNYKVFFIPVPISKPMGKVFSGIATYSKYRPEKSTRYSFPGNYSWPKSLFLLDRCFMLSSYSLSNGKKFIVINTHNSAYDDGSLRKNQMKYLKNILIEEYQKGNYVIVGGDWNQCPPGVKPNFAENKFDTTNFMQIEKNYLPKEWNWTFSNKYPTNRRVMIPYTKGKTPTTIIDYYLCSPNIEILNTETINQDFEYSDHQPVRLEIKLKE